MRAAVLCMLLTAGCAARTPAPAPAALAPAPVPSVPDQDWAGTIDCGPIPGIARIPLHQPFRLTVRSGVARYERDVRVADTSVASGYHEHGQGAVALDGTLTLQGTGEAANTTFQSDFTGVLAGAGSTLDGVQHWRFPRQPPYDRPCVLHLTRVL